MFTIKEIEIAHEKVNTGADFPKYIQEIKQLGVIAFEVWVCDGHTNYYGLNGFEISSDSQYTDLVISSTYDKTAFFSFLKQHQDGNSDYFTFCKHCAETGIEKWIVCLEKLTCTYFDKSNNRVLIEQIPI